MIVTPARTWQVYIYDIFANFYVPNLGEYIFSRKWKATSKTLLLVIDGLIIEEASTPFILNFRMTKKS